MYLAKLTRVSRVVSKSCATINGPSTRINGILRQDKLCQNIFHVLHVKTFK